MNAYYENLKGVERSMYKMAFEFHKDYTENATEDSAHEAGLKELERLGRLRKENSKPQTWVDITTGKTFKAHI